MYVKYGSFTHDANLTNFSFDRQVSHNPRSGTPLIETRRVSMKVDLLATTQADIRTKIDALVTAYQSTGVAWEFYHDDTSLSSHSLPLAGLISPIRVVNAPSFPDSNGAEYATQRSTTITLEANYLLNAFPEVVSFRETVSIVGTGGTRYVPTELVSGAPVIDATCTYTLVRATQSGQAVGFLNYPLYPEPLWPSLEHVEQREQTRSSGERTSIFSVLNYPIQWKYAFTGASAMTGIPNS